MPETKKAQRILVIDDDHVVTRLLESRLKEKGYDVKTICEAADGLQLALNDDPDLVILDVMMPIINGYNFCRLLKNETKHKHLPVILLTSRTEQKDIDIGKEVGADAYLTKPVNIDGLLNTIHQLLPNA